MDDKVFKNQRCAVTNQVSPNRIMDFGKFHLSYCARISDFGSKTTSIVLNNEVFLTLNGDHQDALTKASENNLQGCFDYFLENLAEANHRSEHHIIVKGDNTFDITKNAQRVLGDVNIERLKQAVADLMLVKANVAEEDIELSPFE